MSIRKKISPWREEKWKNHGHAVYKDMCKAFANKGFDVQSVADLPSLKHLAESTSYDISSAICRHLELEKKLKRQGKLMRLIGVKD